MRILDSSTNFGWLVGVYVCVCLWAFWNPAPFLVGWLLGGGGCVCTFWIRAALLIYFGLCWVFAAAWAFPLLRQVGTTLSVRGLLIAVASRCGAQAVGRQDFSNCGARA